MQSIGSVMQMGLNGILIGFSEAAVSVFGAYFKLQSFAFMPVFGLTHGVMPVIGYNYGAGNPGRIKKAIITGCGIALGVMLVGTLLFMCCPAQLLALFSPSDAMMEIGIPALRIMSACFMPAAVGIILSTFYQGVGLGVNSLIISLLRQLIVLLPLAWAFARVGLWLVWYAFPIAEFVSLIVNIVLFIMIWRKYIVVLEQE